MVGKVGKRANVGDWDTERKLLNDTWVRMDKMDAVRGLGTARGTEDRLCQLNI